ncbi:hypothetical protein BC941DRAFT_472800 [Chlamydoabsidia padenii]|nr:hypothetical protein BC941DRAFT_472800 [Chlamydoabsidia padenii]
MSSSLISILKPYRNIRSSTNSPAIIPIHKLSVLHTDNSSVLVLCPSKLRITATLFLNKIALKRDFINIDNKYRVKRQDLLAATEKMIMDSDLNLECRSTNQHLDQNPSPNSPKRPPNAFMLYSGTLRKKIKRTFPEYDNSDISKFLGIMWRSANDNIKQKFIEQACVERQRHKMQYPNFEYNSRKELSNTKSSSEHVPENIAETEEWLKEIQQFVQMTENFETTPYSSLAKMENEALELINSISTNVELTDFGLTDIEQQLLPNHQWINCNLTEELDTRSWRDMCNSISLAYPDPEEYLIFE